MRRAWCSLEGLSVGDGFGECFFNRAGLVAGWRNQRELPPSPWHVTDDTIMALSIVRCLKRHGRIEQDALAQAFAHEYASDPWRGYGGTANTILSAIRHGVPWRTAAGEAFDGQGSRGNGGAMRAAPVGAYFAEDVNQVVAEARASAEVTHAHPDGQTGAVAVALAAAWMVRETGRTRSRGHELIEFVLEHLPRTETFHQLQLALGVPLETQPERAAARLGSGMRIVASDTVPFCLWCAARHPDNYPEALWTTASVLGDVDTNCAIVGGIVALGAGPGGIPDSWLQAREVIRI
jgi:ADP-ribosylglycohydrolase